MAAALEELAGVIPSIAPRPKTRGATNNLPWAACATDYAPMHLRWAVAVLVLFDQVIGKSRVLLNQVFWLAKVWRHGLIPRWAALAVTRCWLNQSSSSFASHSCPVCQSRDRKVTASGFMLRLSRCTASIWLIGTAVISSIMLLISLAAGAISSTSRSRCSSLGIW